MMSIQTNIDQYFKLKLKNNQKVKSRNFVDLKELKRLKKQPKNIKSQTKFRQSNERKHFSSINTSSFHTNKSIDNAQMTDTGTHFMVNINTAYVSDDLLDNETNALSDCSIIYERICTSNNKKSIDKEKATDSEKYCITDSEETCIKNQLQSFEEQVSSSHNDNELIMQSKLFEEGSNTRFSMEEDLKILDVEDNGISKNKYDISTVHSSPVKSILNSPSKQRNLTFSPKKSSTKEILSHNPKTQKNSNLYFRQIVNIELTHTAIENMNFLKEGAILANNFDLQKIYADSSFIFKYNRVDTRASEKYEYDDVIIPAETYAAILFMIVVNVFSNPINCGYFDKDEIDFIFSMFTLSIEAQMLFARILKRKYSWHRVGHLKYNNLADDLIPVCNELVSKLFFISDIENEELSTSLKMLQVDEIRTICKDFKLNHNNKKQSIKKLLEMGAKKPLFPGMKTSGDRLKSLISNKLGYCIRLSQKTKDIFDKVLTLLIPLSQEPQETVSDIYNKLMQIELKKMVFPKFSDKRYPIFSNRNQLIRYIEAKNELTGIMNAIEKKQWETVKKIGKLAYDQWLLIMKNEFTCLENYVVPLHISRFMPGYLWLKILSKSIDAFKKVKETLPFAIEILHKLINQNFYMQRKKETWYAELALIEMHHNKNLEASAKITLKSLKIETLSEVGTAELLERAKKLVKRKNGISNTTSTNIKTTLKFMNSKLKSPILNTITVEATLIKGNFGVSKSKWCTDNNTDNKSYISVENVALNFYYNQGFNGGIHCEGALPVTLFFVLFWEELFNIDIPGAFVTLYQTAPLDLFTKDFYKNRKETIDMKLKLLRSFDPETFSSIVEYNFILNSHFESMMHVKMFTSNNIKEIVYCLGTENVIKICERLIHNFTLWKAGFPDLVIWNSNNKTCKIVEVKGPGDKLSVKQTLWLQYLHEMGVNVEVCLVKDNGKTY
ncbi:fanconi-associated nuclease 1-like isoform X1 [Vespa velutina]|uniref:fanconi-associated nuclease 1-like isoform X1 n=3 Tax=Vespa velutina TaxID=202808 RepID=UPI001FB4FD20|nr:fanconi-associated nuclease 1-like isoform X1 [Vespa velutina]